MAILKRSGDNVSPWMTPLFWGRVVGVRDGSVWICMVAFL